MEREILTIKSILRENGFKQTKKALVMFLFENGIIRFGEHEKEIVKTWQALSRKSIVELCKNRNRKGLKEILELN